MELPATLSASSEFLRNLFSLSKKEDERFSSIILPIWPLSCYCTLLHASQEEMCFCVTILIAFFHLDLKVGNQSNRARNADKLI